MSIKAVAALFCGVFVLATTAQGQTAFERSSNKAVEDMLDSVSKNTDEFRGALDKTFRTSVLRGEKGEVDVEAYLDDLEMAVKAASDRFTDKYSASNEVKDMLSRAAPMHTYVRAHPELKGASEWDQLAGDLNRLATAYGVSFPLAADANVRRIGDGELSQSLTALGKIGESASSALRKTAKDTPTLAPTVDSLTAVTQTSEALQTRISKDQPATAEARRLKDLATKVDGLVADSAVPGAVKDLWKPAAEHVTKVVQAFGL